MAENRKDILLKAAYDLLKQQEEGKKWCGDKIPQGV